MDLESTFLPESSKSDSTFPKWNTGSTHPPAPVDAEQVTKNPTPKTPGHPTAGLEHPAASRFRIRSAKSLSLDLSTRSKEKNLRTLVSIFEPQDPGTGNENSKVSQANSQEGALGAPTHKVSMVINRNTPYAWITSKSEPWPKNSNQPKTTALEQMRQTEYTREVKPQPTDPMSQVDQSGQGAGERGRSEWRRVNLANRTKSLDWRSESSHVDKGERTGMHEIHENLGVFIKRRSGSLERGRGGDKGRIMTIPETSLSSRTKEYNLGEKVATRNLKTTPVDQPVILGRSRSVPLPLQPVNRGQSLPSRIKPRLSDKEVEEDISVWGLHPTGRRRAVDMFSNKTILDRIEQLYSPVMSDMSTKYDSGSLDRLKAKRNSASVEDWSQYRKGNSLSHHRNSFSNDPPLALESSHQRIGEEYEGRQGGTFPRRHFKGEKKNCEMGSTWISRNGNDGRNIYSWRSSNIAKPVSESGDIPPWRLQTSLTEWDESGGSGGVVDGSKDSQPFTVKPRTVISIPKAMSPQQQVTTILDNPTISVRELPEAFQDVTDGWEKERECKKGKEEIKDMGYDLDPGREEGRNELQYELRFCERKTEEKIEKHEKSPQSCSNTKDPKPLKADAVCERSPTVNFCGALDSSADSFPKLKMASVSQPASTALGGVTKESKQDLVVCPGGRPESSLAIQPAPKSFESSNWRGRKEKDTEQDYIFRINSTFRVPGNRPNGELKTGVVSTFLDNVRSKIFRFESLSQRSNSLPPYHLLQSRSPFSAPDPPKEVLGLKKSDSDRALGGVKGQESVGFGAKEYFRSDGGAVSDEGVRRNRGVRSHSVDEERLWMKKDCSGREAMGGWINFTQQTKWSAYKEPSYNTTINTEPQRDFRASCEEPDSSRASQPETKYASGLPGETSKSKDLMPTLQTTCNNPNRTGSITGIANVRAKNGSDSINTSETDKGDKTHMTLSSRSPFISNKSYGISGSTCSDQASESGRQASASTQSTTATVLPPVCGISGIPSASPTPVSETAPSNFLPHPATSSSSTDPQLSSGATRQNQAFGVCSARWSSDEDLSGDDDDGDDEDDDDDDDEGTEKGSSYDSDSGESSVTITSNMSQSDRLSFSMSLADLCHFGGVDYKGHDDDLQDTDTEDCMSHRTASLSSDISALSTISIMPAEELDQLLEEVRGIGDETLQNYEDVQVVVLHKEVGSGLGFTVAGGVDQNKPITVHKVFPFGLAYQEGSMKEGDRVLSINGTVLKDSAHWEALRTLRRARNRGMAVVVLQKGGATETRKSSTDRPKAAVDQRTVKKAGGRIQVVLNKSSTDLGFSLEGGFGSNMGDRPLVVKKLFQGGPVDDVFAGDELLEIEGQSMHGLRRVEAWNLIKKLPHGPVDVVLNRPF